VLYRGMDRAQLDAAYNNSAEVPERDAIVADWAARSARVRREHAGRLDLAYGDELRGKVAELLGGTEAAAAAPVTESPDLAARRLHLFRTRCRGRLSPARPGSGADNPRRLARAAALCRLSRAGGSLGRWLAKRLARDDRDQGEFAERHLQERQVNLERMLSRMGRIEHLDQLGLDQAHDQRAVDRHAAQPPRRTCPTDLVGEPSRLRRRLIASITSPPPI